MDTIVFVQCFFGSGDYCWLTVNESFRLGQMAQRLAKSIILVVLACALESALSIVFAPILLG